jgi:hypothetical protein
MPKKIVGKTYYTKHKQPYKILASGKAMFLKKTKKGGSVRVAGSVSVGGSVKRKKRT